MSAIRPNLNFYNERQEHVPYQDSVAEKARAAYQGCNKTPERYQRNR